MPWAGMVSFRPHRRYQPLRTSRDATAELGKGHEEDTIFVTAGGTTGVETAATG